MCIDDPSNTIPDAWSLYAQIGKFPPHPPSNPQPISDCEQIFDWDTGRLNPKLKPENNEIFVY